MALAERRAGISQVDAMFALRYAMFVGLRFGLVPVVLFCGLLAVMSVVATIDVARENTARKSSWRETVATVVQSHDRGDVVKDYPFLPFTSPDPTGTITYLVDGETHTWEGRARQLGVTTLAPGERIKVYYNPGNPKVVHTLVKLGAPGMAVLLATLLAFLTYYVWFFWLRGSPRRSLPADPSGTPPPDRLAGRIERVHGPTFGKR